MIEASKSDLLRPPGSSEEDNAPINVDAILQSMLGRGIERFGMATAVLRGERIIAQGAAGVRKRGAAERITLDDQFHLGLLNKAILKAVREPQTFWISSEPPVKKNVAALMDAYGLFLREQLDRGRETKRKRSRGGLAVAAVLNDLSKKDALDGSTWHG